jgi:hypothetical protein
MYLTSSVELSTPITVRSLAAARGLLITFNSEIRVVLVLQLPPCFCRKRVRLKVTSLPVPWREEWTNAGTMWPPQQYSLQNWNQRTVSTEFEIAGYLSFRSSYLMQYSQITYGEKNIFVGYLKKVLADYGYRLLPTTCN